MPDVLYVLDLREGRNVYVNREVWRVLGYTPEQVPGMDRGTLESLVHPDDLARAREDSHAPPVESGVLASRPA